MTRPSRRTMLCSTAALIGLSAGCLSDSASDTPDEDDDGANDDPGSPSANATESEPKSTGDETTADLPDGLADYQTVSFQYSESSETDVQLLRDGDRVADWLEARSLSDFAPVADFVDETDFENSILLSLEAGTPTPCYELVLESIDIEGGDESAGDSSGESSDETLVLEGAVQEKPDSGTCSMQLATVGRLVRVTFESEPLTTVSATIVGHDGSTTGVSMASNSASASESSSIGSASGSGSDSQSGDGS